METEKVIQVNMHAKNYERQKNLPKLKGLSGVILLVEFDRMHQCKYDLGIRCKDRPIKKLAALQSRMGC